MKKVKVESDLFSTSCNTPPAEYEERYSFHIEADEELMQLYNQAKALVGPLPMREVFKRVLKSYLKIKSPVERAKRRHAKEVKSTQSRKVPVSVKDQVFLRDKSQCSFVSKDGIRCTEKHALQIDHVRPWALGGTHEESNLRLLCSAHNKLMAERVFGKEKIASKIERGILKL